MHVIDLHTNTTINELISLLNSKKQITLSEKVKQEVINCRKYLDEVLKSNETSIYGINTGFGSLANTKISSENLEQLQENLVKSHACGVGEEIPLYIAKLILLLKIKGLSLGKSGISIELLERLVFLYNENIIPVIYEQGSLGASGDLAPLAHMSLPLLGLGEVYHKEVKKKSIEVLKEFNLQPLKLKAKEGLALLNGTQFMSAFGVWIIFETKKIIEKLSVVSLASLEAFDGILSPFNYLLHQVRSHSGQVKIAEAIQQLANDSEILNSEKKYVQDPYSFRCIPQVHGASLDMLNYAQIVFETEVNSVTDNPTVFYKEEEIISGGNFHGQPLALALDALCMAIAELSSISERRVYKLISGQRGLPPFLSPNSGLNSGFMIAQYTVASIVSQNKQYCTPSVVDTIDSSNGQEDHVSMGANAALKCFKVLTNTEKVISIELLTAMQALEFRTKKISSSSFELKNKFRKEIPFIQEDVEMHIEMKKAFSFFKNKM